MRWQRVPDLRCHGTETEQTITHSPSTCHNHVIVVVVVVMTSPSGIAYMGGQKCPEEMRNSTRLWIQKDLSLPRDS